MPNEKRASVRKEIEEQMRGWNLAGETAESAMFYIACREGKKWSTQEFFNNGASELKEYVTDFFKKMNFDPKGKRVLDIGCGIGRITLAFGDIFLEAHGVDFSSNLTKVAQEINKDKPNLYFRANNGVDLSAYADNFFDFCFSFITFHHIKKQEVVGNYIREVDRVLKPGGLFMFQVNTDKWVIKKAFGWLPIHYRVQDFLQAVGIMKWYTKIKTRNSTQASTIVRTLPVYYTSPKKLEKVFKTTKLEVIQTTGENSRYNWFYARKR